MGTETKIHLPPCLEQETDFWDLSKRSIQVQRRDRYLPDPKGNSEEVLTLKAGRTWPDVAGAVIDTYSAPGDWLLDPTVGTGVTMVEGVWRQRNALGVELSPVRAELAGKHLELADRHPGNGRWQLFVGDARELLPRLPEPPKLVIIDPPFSETRMDGGENHFGGVLGNYTGEDRIKSRGQRDQRNLGNLKHRDYLVEMFKVYHLGLAVAAKGAYLAIILKDYRKHHRRIDLLGDTRRICEEAGWRYYDRATLYLGTASQQQRRNAKVNNHLIPITQDLLVFRKVKDTPILQGTLPLLA